MQINWAYLCKIDMVEFVLNFMVNDHIAHKAQISVDQVHVQAKRVLNS